jgi:hypothetical protein
MRPVMFIIMIMMWIHCQNPLLIHPLECKWLAMECTAGTPLVTTGTPLVTSGSTGTPLVAIAIPLVGLQLVLELHSLSLEYYWNT